MPGAYGNKNASRDWLVTKGVDTPNKPRGTIKGHKITPAQQRLFGTARGFQEKGGATKGTPAARIAKSIAPSDLHKIAQKPKGGYRSRKK